MVDSSFHHAERGMTRFPANIEQITIQHASTCSWLIVRRNETELRFPLQRQDREYLARLLVRSDESETIAIWRDGELVEGAASPSHPL